jgi:hypothetical protein
MAALGIHEECWTRICMRHFLLPWQMTMASNSMLAYAFQVHVLYVSSGYCMCFI